MMEAEQLDLRPIIRPFRETDRDFIEASWIAHYVSKLAKNSASKAMLRLHQRAIVRSIMCWPGTRIAIAATAGFDDAILGWMVADGTVLHYCYIKQDFRGFGILGQMLEAMGLELGRLSYSHATPRICKIMRRYPGSRYEPKAALAR